MEQGQGWGLGEGGLVQGEGHGRPMALQAQASASGSSRKPVCPQIGETGNFLEEGWQEQWGREEIPQKFSCVGLNTMGAE